MKLGLIETSLTLGVLVTAASLSITACTSSSSAGNNLFSDGGASSGGSSSGGTDPPHALGVVALGESHVSGESTTSPFVSASFVPDSTQMNTCTTSVAGCTVPMIAKCDGLDGHPTACGVGTTCALDSSCNTICLPTCTAECPTGEQCTIEPSTGAQSCQPIEQFNAGVLAFSGTTQPLTLFPPYTFTTSGEGSLFLAGASLEVQGAGATSAGFTAFDQKFTATTFMQTSPSLTTISPDDVWGQGSIPVGWVPGTDSVVVSVSGTAGTAQCAAVDSTGQFSIPRAVVDQIVGTGTASLTISVTRTHEDWNKSLKTIGSLPNETVQPIAFLDVETSSTESFAFQGCGTGLLMCSGVCTDVLSSVTNCGSCGNVCPTGDYCENGACYGTSGCGTLTSCPDGCENLQTSITDCGVCGNHCPTGDVCSGGTCVTSTGCGSLATCPDGCQNLETSLTDCGTCDNACPSGDTCSSGSCVVLSSTCSTCETSAEEGTCATQYAACADDTNCSSYESCVQGCAAGNTSCVSSCKTTYSTAVSEAENLQTCLCNTACSTQCAGDSYCALAL